ncbi:putative transmembrane protein [Toxoplasma gondii VAND]|uniref:Putative transmembrane protein n=1 Tax=Toxoplasma gondii VAND TaxID=933077 RepID=A0A086Q2J6_TOXGO|nr:putative transmembrane protein [Toxoplasma gondii VAND]
MDRSAPSPVFRHGLLVSEERVAFVAGVSASHVALLCVIGYTGRGRGWTVRVSLVALSTREPHRALSRRRQVFRYSRCRLLHCWCTNRRYAVGWGGIVVESHGPRGLGISCAGKNSDSRCRLDTVSI